MMQSKFNCTPGFNLREKSGMIVVCPWSPEAHIYEEFIQMKEKLTEEFKARTHGICDLHKEEMLELAREKKTEKDDTRYALYDTI